MAIALARRYRPRRFADLLVQDHVAAALRGAVARGRVAHGYLLTGPRGVGKTTAARILAMALNCERREHTDPPGEPCGECQSCERVWSGSANLDVVEIDAASNRGVDDARDLRERAMYAASQAGHHKVYIVDEAHMLTREAWNALLKILEEPPPGVVFVFATTEPQKIAATAAPVLSRLQRFDFRRIGPAAIRTRLRQVLDLEKLSAEDDALTLIARCADGGMRDALSVLDQCLSFGEGPITAARVRETLGLVPDEVFARVLRIVLERDPRAVFPLIDELMEQGVDLVEFMNGIAEMLRALLIEQLGGTAAGLTEAMRQTIVGAANQFRSEDVLRMLKLLADSEGGIRRSGNARLTVETLLLRWAMMDRVVDLEQVLAGGVGNSPARPAVAREPASSPSGPAPVASTKVPARPAPTSTVTLGAAEPVAFTLSGLLGVWGDLVAAARAQSPLLGEVLAVARPASVAAPVVTLSLDAEHAVMQEGLLQRRSAIEGLLAARLGGPVELKVVGAAMGTPSQGRPERLSEVGLKADRLRRLREKDAALDLAADELDLEIVDEPPRGK